MSPEAQRIEIAKACGWWGIEGGSGYEVGVPPEVRETGNFNHDRWVPRQDLPDFLNSRDACALFEGKLWGDEQKQYIRELLEFTQTPEDAIFASPEQRCLAFLKMKGITP